MGNHNLFLKLCTRVCSVFSTTLNTSLHSKCQRRTVRTYIHTYILREILLRMYIYQISAQSKDRAFQEYVMFLLFEYCWYFRQSAVVVVDIVTVTASLAGGLMPWLLHSCGVVVIIIPIQYHKSSKITIIISWGHTS